MCKTQYSWVDEMPDVVRELVVDYQRLNKKTRITDLSQKVANDKTYLSKLMGGHKVIGLSELKQLSTFFDISEEDLILRAKKNFTVFNN